MTRWVALLRGINVGTAKRIAMADLRAFFEGAGYTGVRTLLQSGNVVFDAPDDGTEPSADALESAVHTATGVTARMLLVPGDDFVAAVKANPIVAEVTDPSRGFITFVEGELPAVEPDRPSDDDLAPEKLVISGGHIYQWCPDGLTSTRIPAKYFRSLGVTVTQRNLRTTSKLVGMVLD